MRAKVYKLCTYAPGLGKPAFEKLARNDDCQVAQVVRLGVRDG